MASQNASELLVVGLGNPGEEFAYTRHSAGRTVVEELARRNNATYWKSEAGADVCEIRLGDKSVTLACPQTFMNVSGGPVAKLAAARHLPRRQVIVVHDELEIVAGQVGVRVGGGAAGHNGLRSITNKLGGADFVRVRVGIGRPPGRMSPADYVLRKLKGAQLEEFQLTCMSAADAVEECVRGGIVTACRKYGSPTRSTR